MIKTNWTNSSVTVSVQSQRQNYSDRRFHSGPFGQTRTIGRRKEWKSRLTWRARRSTRPGKRTLICVQCHPLILSADIRSYVFVTRHVCVYASTKTFDSEQGSRGSSRWMSTVYAIIKGWDVEVKTAAFQTACMSHHRNGARESGRDSEQKN